MRANDHTVSVPAVIIGFVFAMMLFDRLSEYPLSVSKHV